MATSSSTASVNVSSDGSLPSNNEANVTDQATQATELKGKGRKRTRDEDNAEASEPHQKGKKCSWLWAHFTKFEIGKDERAQCHYCPNHVSGGSKSGTTVMKNHLDRCRMYPPNVDKAQKLISLQSDLTGGDCGDTSVGNNSLKSLVEKRGKLELWKFNQADTRAALSKMIIMDERPFRTVEHDGFRLFCSVACPHFMIPSRWTIARDCFDMYLEEKSKLKTYFSKLSSRICLTTDTWTSCQNLSYMCLTAHFIDQNWKLHKKVINFCPIVGHTGEIIGKSIENCLIEWGITTKVLTVTVDNASANDVGVEYLRDRLRSWSSTILDGKYLQIRCVSHILSLTVKEGLKDSNDSIYRVRNAVRFVRSSPARLLKFNVCVKKEQIDSSRHLCLDVETRWNSTYLMLDSALIYRKAFLKLETSDNGKFVTELSKNRGVPTEIDWECVSSLLPFLKIFYDATLRLSGSLYITTNVYLQEIVGIGMMIDKKCESSDVGVKLMASGMKKKHAKYWENVDKVNVLLYVAVVLDPRRKMQYVNWAINQQYDYENSVKLRSKVLETITSLYVHYTESQPTQMRTPPPEVEVSPDECENMDDWQDVVESQFERDVSSEITNDKKSDMDKYLEDVREVNSKKFDVLDWWKKHEEAYPIVALMARDILAIPVSTVASESAFSTGGRILDQFRSSLSSRMVEGLVCAQDWLRSTRGPLLAEEYVEEVEKFDKEVLYITNVSLYTLYVSKNLIFIEFGRELAEVLEEDSACDDYF
ncbi:hypothetical protein KSS87_022521 [Heliosperma pusillum]|nr:hypothetical protein KSS87_003560 [Heliosperma pusillum]KAH9614120.1 hypothetical protein KSS87_022521 [Heliosperma pusillum]